MENLDLENCGVTDNRGNFDHLKLQSSWLKLLNEINLMNEKLEFLYNTIKSGNFGNLQVDNTDQNKPSKQTVNHVMGRTVKKGHLNCHTTEVLYPDIDHKKFVVVYVKVCDEGDKIEKT